MIRYWGEIMSADGSRWKMEVTDSTFSGVAEELTFPLSPLVLEWESDSKIDPLMGCRATLRVVSVRDRMFTILYRVRTGEVALRLYRWVASAWVLQWVGGLDPEFYEEEYAEANGYEVSMSFTDFGQLERYKWDRHGFISVKAAIERCFAKAGIEAAQLVWLVGTLGSLGETPEQMLIHGDNFYDEDDEAMTYKEVLSAILQPFALRAEQRGGKVYIYDLHTLAAQSGTTVAQTEIEWVSTDAVMSADVVYNNVRVSFNPYSRPALTNDEVEVKATLKDFTYNVPVNNETYTHESGEFLVWSNPNGFEASVYSTFGKGVTKGTNARWLRIKKGYSGESVDAVVWMIKEFSPSGSTTSRINTMKSSLDYPWNVCELVVKTPGKYIGKVPEGEQYNRNLRVIVDALLDCRMNPFEKPSDQNPGWALPSEPMVIGVACRILLRDEEGVVVQSYINRSGATSNAYQVYGEWVNREAAWGECFLCYYDPQDRKNANYGWSSNKRLIGYYGGGLPDDFQKGDGAIIGYPSKGGYLEIEIGSMLLVNGSDSIPSVSRLYYPVNLSWMAFKAPRIELLDKYGNAEEAKDIERKGWLNRDAFEDVSYDTVIGTVGSEIDPTALGQVWRTSDGMPIPTFVRAGRYDLLEHLLIGTVYSQYANNETPGAGEFPRKYVLSGTMAPVYGFSTLTDRNMTGKVFVKLSETVDVAEGESEVRCVEFTGDQFGAVEIDE